MNFHTLASVAALVVLSPIAVSADDARIVYVSGRGLVRVTPDQVVIRLTATTTDDDLIRVRENSDKDAQTILTIAKKHGGDDDGFEVSRLELSLDYNDQLRRRIYQVDRDIAITLGNLAKLDLVLSDLLGERNLRVVGISFVTSKLREHEFEALRRAVADAKDKGAHLAELNGFQLGAARDIRVTRESQHPFVTSVIPVVGSAMPPGRDHDAAKLALGAIKNPVRFAAFQPPADAAEATGKNFALGMIEVEAHVEINFELAK